MDFEFLQNSMKKTAFSGRPLSILDHKERDAFTSIMEILLLETGDRQACEQWQEQQLAALITHARKRSGFWRNKSGLVKPALENLKFLPILTRKDVTKQVLTEGALLTKADRIGFSVNSTSGSSGTPVSFYSSASNAKYNGLRTFSQDVLEQRDFRENTTIINLSDLDEPSAQNRAFRVQIEKGRLGPLTHVFEGGAVRKVTSLGSQEDLFDEFRKHTPHNLVCIPSVLDLILGMGGAQRLKELGVKRWIQNSESRSLEIDRSFKDAGISISANYSSEETGPIAFECSKRPGQYHVAISNVIVETDDRLTTEVDGETLSRVLITHLHSYATPFIRYDIGDFAKLSRSCTCGHDGPTLSNIYGRAKRFIILPNGRYIPFQFRAKSIFGRVNCTEFQIHQKDLNTIVIRIGGRESLSEREKVSLVEFIQYKTDESFNIQIRPMMEIDWQGNPKKLGFTSAVA